MKLDLVTAATSEPILLDEAKDHLRVDIGADDGLIQSRLKAARQAFEKAYMIAFMTQTWDWYLDDFPATTFDIPIWPLASITSIKYTDEDDAETTYNSANYRVDTISRPGQVVLKSTASWPSVTLKEVNAVVIRFVAGYTSRSNVPEPVKAALLLVLGDLYELREDTLVNERASISAEKLNISQMLMMNYRSFNF